VIVGVSVSVPVTLLDAVPESVSPTLLEGVTAGLPVVVGVPLTAEPEMLGVATALLVVVPVPEGVAPGGSDAVGDGDGAPGTPGASATPRKYSPGTADASTLGATSGVPVS